MGTGDNNIKEGGNRELFANYQYQRLNMEEYVRDFKKALSRFGEADSIEGKNKALQEINRLRGEFGAMKTIAFIRHSQDVEDEYYSQENDFFYGAAREHEELISEHYRALLSTEFREELQEQWGEQLFELARQSRSTFAPEVADDLQEESRLAGEYMNIMARARVRFAGRERNIMELNPYLESPERATRKKAHAALTRILAQNEEQLDQLFHNLVGVRHRIARELGFDNFLGLGYARLGRSDYTPAMVADFREQVQQHITPLIVELRARQARRLGLDSLKYYDEDIKFSGGNAVPRGGPAEIIASSRIMYREMSRESGEFFQFMEENGLLDLEDRDNKAKMGYCATIPGYRVPFVFATFNGTSYDVGVMTHELGHAFQAYCSRDFSIPEYIDATAEVSEIHALTMELMAWPWLHLFFGEDADKYRFASLTDAINLGLPIGVMGDEFQQWIYENPAARPEERKEAWREIEKKYWPYKDYDGNEFLEQGGWWLKFVHFFQFPLYLIDYSLAQICAFQFFGKSREDYPQAWADYVSFCKAGGSASFSRLLQKVGLQSPFEPGCVAGAIRPVVSWLEEVDEKDW